MDKQELQRLGPAIDSYLREFERCAFAPTRRLIAAYVRGQLGPLPRKSVMPMALDAGIPPRTMQELLSLHRWNDRLMTDLLQKRVARLRGKEAFYGVVVESSCVKRGKRTPGVERQYRRASGRMENCVVLVHLLAAGPQVSLLDTDLYLPETWARDPARRRTAGIPEEAAFRTPAEVARDLIRRAQANGVEFDGLLFGPDHFSEEALGGQRFVVEVPAELRGWTRSTGDGPAWALEVLASRAGFEPFTIRSRPWSVAAFAFWPEQAGRPGPARRIVAVRPSPDGPARYLLSDMASGGSPGDLLEMSLARDDAERAFAEHRTALGLDHFEVRSYRSLIRHYTLSAVSMQFLAERGAKRASLRAEPGGINPGLVV